MFLIFLTELNIERSQCVPLCKFLYQRNEAHLLN